MIDMTGMLAIRSMLTSIAKEGMEVILCGKEEIINSILQQLNGHIAHPVRAAVSVKAALI